MATTIKDIIAATETASKNLCVSDATPTNNVPPPPKATAATPAATAATPAATQATAARTVQNGIEEITLETFEDAKNITYKNLKAFQQQHPKQFPSIDKKYEIKRPTDFEDVINKIKALTANET